MSTPAASSGANGRPVASPHVWHLVVADGLSVATGWLVGAFIYYGPLTQASERLSVALLLVGVIGLTMAGIAGRHLYGQAAADRAGELVGCARACLIAALAAQLATWTMHIYLSPQRVVFCGLLSLILLSLTRATARTRVTTLHRRGQAVTPVLVVGANDEALELCALLEEDADFGFRTCGILGDRALFEDRAFRAPWLGDVLSAPEVAHELGVHHVFVARSAMTAPDFALLSRRLGKDGVDIVVGTGLPGVDPRRLEVVPVATRPMLSLASRRSRGGEALKRAFDMTLASLALAVALPIMVLAGAAIALVDGSPILFRQTRVGRYGAGFTMYKFRTMVPGADTQVVDLREQNERQGPLFKLTRDPRVSRLGRLLREMKIDELPQLINVLRGQMSLVGPRPALPAETAEFSRALLGRHGARPGMTGLWQVEAGDEPSFELYERLDLFYVENQSFALDIAILLSTVPAVVWRGVDRLTQARRRAGSDAPAAAAGGERPELIVLETLPRPDVRTDIAVAGSPQARPAALRIGTALAERGLTVALYDPDRRVVDRVQRGQTTSGEPHPRGRRAVEDGRLQASADPRAVAGAECLVVVPPTGHHRDSAARRAVMRLIEAIQSGLRDGQLLILEHGLYPGANNDITGLMACLGLDIDVAFCREGCLQDDAWLKAGAPRPMVAAATPRAMRRAEQLWQRLTAAGALDAGQGLAPDQATAQQGGW